MTRLQSLARPLRTTPWRLSLLHSDPSHRLIWVTQGQARLIHDARRRGVGPGQLIAIPAGAAFAMEAGPQITGVLFRLQPQDDIPWCTRAMLIRANDMQNPTHLQHAFDTIQREQDGDAAFAEDALSAQLMALSVWIRRQADATAVTKPTASDRLILRFFDRLHATYAQGATMGDHANALGVTPTHLSRVCKTALGKSAANLVNERLLHAARDLLYTTNLPATDIAVRLGFGSAAYFSRFVKTKTGHAPSDLRRISTTA